MFQRSWVLVPALYTGWTFFTYYCCKNCNVWLKRPKINQKRGRGWPIFLKNKEDCPFLSAAKGQRPRNCLSCCCSCWCYQWVDYDNLHMNCQWYTYLCIANDKPTNELTIIYLHMICQWYTYLLIANDIPTYELTIPTYELPMVYLHMNWQWYTYLCLTMIYLPMNWQRYTFLWIEFDIPNYEMTMI